MTADVGRRVAALPGMTVGQLQAEYAAAFGEPTAGRNKAWLVRKVAWRLQANASGGLTDRARRRAAELAAGADLRATPPRAAGATAGRVAVVPAPRPAGDRAGPPGTVIARAYKGGTVRVTVRADGFEYAGAVYPSLSAVAKVVTGSHLNGYRFFRLGPAGGGA